MALDERIAGMTAAECEEAAERMEAAGSLACNRWGEALDDRAQGYLAAADEYRRAAAAKRAVEKRAQEQQPEVETKHFTYYLCPGTTDDLDPNTLDRTAPRADGHRYMLGTRYADGGHDATCLKCGNRVRLEAGER